MTAERALLLDSMVMSVNTDANDTVIARETRMSRTPFSGKSPKRLVPIITYGTRYAAHRISPVTVCTVRFERYTPPRRAPATSLLRIVPSL